jgi:phage-related protein
MLTFKVFFYEEEGSPVEDFLNGLPKKAREKISARIVLLEERGNQMPRQYSDKLTASPLWELKIKYRTNEYRIFYFFSEKVIILVHGFMKKTEETPKADIELSERRMEKWLSRRKR